MSPIQIGLKVERPRQTIETFLKRWKTTKTIINKYGGNKPKALDVRTTNHLARMALTNRHSTAKELKIDLGIKASEQTVRNYLKKRGIRARRPKKKPALTKKHKLKRLKFAKDHENWNIEHWRRVLWSDEKKLNLHAPDGNARVWRRKGEELRDECVEPKWKFGGGSVMIWGAIAGNGLRIIEEIKGTLNAIKYQKKFEENLLESFNEYGDSLDFFQEDNDPKHGGPNGAKSTRIWFENHPELAR